MWIIILGMVGGGLIQPSRSSDLLSTVLQQASARCLRSGAGESRNIWSLFMKKQRSVTGGGGRSCSTNHPPTNPHSYLRQSKVLKPEAIKSTHGTDFFSLREAPWAKANRIPQTHV